MSTFPLYWLTLVSCLWLPDVKSYYKKKVNFGHAIPFSTSRHKMEGCEKWPLSPSIDWHWIDSCLCLPDVKSYYKK